MTETPRPPVDSTCAATSSGSVHPTAGWLFALIAWTAILVFYDLDGGARFEPTDCWVAQTAREMQQSGDYIIPRFSGEVRMQKSPGPYWAVIAASRFLGEPEVTEVSSRIPNGVAALVLVVSVFWLTRRIAGDRAAVFAGFAASSSVLVLYWSHRGASDLGLAALCTLSLAALWVATECERPGAKRNALWMLGYFAAGLAMLHKMPMPLVCVGLPAFLYVLVRNRWAIFASPWHLLGIGLFFLPWLPWVIAVVMQEPAAIHKWRVEYFDRFTGELPNVEDQKTDVGMYFLYLVPPLLYCLPYSLSLPGAILRGFRHREDIDRGGLIFNLIWFFSLLVFFTLAAGKEMRYFLPALPPLFVLLGIELATFFDPRRAPNARLRWAGAIAVWVLAPAFFVGAILIGLRKWFQLRGSYEGFSWPEVWIPVAVTGAIFTMGAALSAWLYVRRRGNYAFGTLVVTMWTMWLWFWPQVMPVLVSQRPFIDFAMQLRERIPASEQDHIYQIAQQDPRIIWYSDYRFPRIIDQLDLLEEQGGKRDIVYEKRRVGEEMIAKLNGTSRALLCSSLLDYFTFLALAPPAIREHELEMPRAYVWLRSRYGRADHHYVLVGNEPPPWPEPPLVIPEEVKPNARAAIQAGLDAIHPEGRAVPGPVPPPVEPPGRMPAQLAPGASSVP